MRKIILIQLFVLFSLFLSCSKEYTFQNPNDPNVIIDTWKPTELIITPISATSLKLSWIDNCTNEQGFKVSRKVGNGVWEENIATVGENITQWTDTNAPIGNTYSYKVRVFASNNISSWIEESYVFHLSAPTNLSINPLSTTSLKLTWQDSNQFEQGFKISRKVGNGAWEENIAIVGGNITQWTDINAPIGSTYTYKVKSYTETNSSSGVEKSYTFQLSAPTNLSIAPLSATSLKLTWQDSNQFEQGFKISRKVGSGAWEENIASVGENITQWTDTVVNSDIQLYEYKVRAYCNNVYSEYSNTTSNSPRFVLVPGGTFQMGSSSGDSDESPIHSVTLSSFYIGKYEVTQSEWQAVMGSNPSSNYGVGADYPVYNVSWYSVLVYCNKRSILEGLTPCYTKNGDTNPNNWGSIPTSNNSSWNAITCNWSANGYRLPTEAEWEYAARGGNQSQGFTYSGSNTIGNVAWYSGNSGSTTHQVGTKAPNELGIFDMSGNVWEWCWDWYGSYSSNAQTNPKGPTNGSGRVGRGGSWGDGGDRCRVTIRDFYNPGSGNGLGFRLSRTSW